MSMDNQVDCTSKSPGVNAKVISRRIPRIALAALTLASFGGFASAQVLPNNVEPTSTCNFAPTEFPGWFETGTATAGGAVKPADSLNFLNFPADPVPTNHSHCKFYKWAARMFLWLTSPLSGGGRTLQSDEFYDISPLVNNERTLTRNDPGKADIDFSLRTSKTFDHGALPGPRRGVLMAQNNSLLYTASFVNDVYAYYMTGAKNHRPGFDGSKFPIWPTELNAISALAMGHGIALRHPEVLALQVKTTWLDTAGFGDLGLDPNKYIRIKGKIPTYDMSDPKKWIRNIASNGSNVTKDAELALVGVHITGSASGNSDMIWATFEHVDNVPIATYAYRSTSGRQDFPQSTCRKDAQNTCRPWLFSQSNAPAAADVVPALPGR